MSQFMLRRGYVGFRQLVTRHHLCTRVRSFSDMAVETNEEEQEFITFKDKDNENPDEQTWDGRGQAESWLDHILYEP
eukprot:UN00449